MATWRLGVVIKSAAGESDVAAKSIHHAICVITKDPVQTHTEPIADDMFLLHIPTQGVFLKAVKERDESAVPVGVVHVDGVDSAVVERRGSAFGTFFDA